MTSGSQLTEVLAPLGIRPPHAHVPEQWPRFRLALYWQLAQNYIDTWPARLYEELVIDCSAQFPRTFLVNDPAIIRDIFRRGSDDFQSCAHQRRICTSLFGGPSIATSEGDDWLADRARYEAALTPYAVSRADLTIAANAERLVRSWSDEGRNVRIDKAIARFSLANIAFLALGWERGAELDAIADAIDGVRSSVGRISLVSVTHALEFMRLNTRGRGSGALAELERMVFTEISRRKLEGHGNEGDLLSAYLLMAKGEGGDAATDRRACSNALAMLAAGFDTTASALTWFLYLLALSPGVQDRVRQELRNIEGQDSTAGTGAMPMTRAALTESLRLYPPLPLLARTAMRDYQHGAVRIPAGFNVFVSPYVVQRHRRLWDDPDRFDPERFIGTRRKEHAVGAYIPFGVGRRSCVGMQLANREIIMAASAILGAFDLAALPQHSVRLRSGMGLRAESGITLCLERRH